ncbi:reverse transcriptase [Kalmanozyma brasiliensis GHG001]|uniref:reverse transcriptase n=1 Tax=Kalmanozyma brasiliensis (strain GHG001) TaxID=1365824 RepID=UPI0028682257|nr:reverse transcriptase [Kalmanozyma brasiliensis GHG001]EST06693.2 reverse transcriptase [Kalmanozyma brasiliensis GHG001]
MPVSEPGDGARCSVLERHFARVVPLLTFVRELFDIEVAATSSKQTCALSEEQWQRLSHTLVGINDCSLASLASPPPHRPAASQNGPCTTIHEAVQEAQLQILTKASAHANSETRAKYDASNNVLLKGYRRPDDRLESFRVTSTGRPGLINLYPNSMVTCLVLEKEWHFLFERIGSARFVWLLVNTSLFVPLLRDGADGTCYVQLTGTAVSEAATSRSVATASDPPAGLNAAGLKRKHSETLPVARLTESALNTDVDSLAPALAPLALSKRARTFERVDSRFSVRSATSAPELDGVRGRASAPASVDRKPSEIVFVRSRMFYARCSRNKSGRVEVGLPSVHVLPRSSVKKELDKVLPSSTASSTRSRSVVRSLRGESKGDIASQQALFHERRTRHLAKYVFPRQFGLHNVFTGVRDFGTTTQPFRDYTVREIEIKALGAKRTPKALRPVLPLLAKILARHDNLNYRALLDRCCPSRVPKGRLTAQERQQIVEDLAEVETLEATLCQDLPVNGTQKERSRSALASTTQANVVNSQASTAKAPLKVAFELPPPAPRKPRYTNYAVPTTGQVVHFITLAIKALLPRDLFGSLRNQNLILSSIGDFVRLRRYETFNLHHIAQSFRFTDVDWALPPAAVSHNRRLSRSEADSRKALILELLYWLFDGLVIPLLRTTFYITETAAYRNKVLYFRQDDWHVLSRPVLGQLKESIFEPLTRAEALSMMSSRKLGYSHVRLLPKETGVRPIVNLRRRSNKQVHNEQQQRGEGKGKGKVRGGTTSAKQKRESLMLGQSINYILQSVFHVLTYEKSRLLTSFGGNDRERSTGMGGGEDVGHGMLSSSVFGPNEIYTSLRTFKQHLAQDHSRTGAPPKLYFIKVDVRCAFDSIDQTKLLSIIESILHRGATQNEEEGYRIHRFAKVMPSTSSTKREFVRLARPDAEHIDFFSLASSLAVALHDVVFVDSVAYRYESTALILKLLRQHITENLIKIGKEFYRQRVGIPQGSSLSTLLCSFFYADMESRDPFLGSLRTDGRSLLMRYTDDFLLITTSRRTARRFYTSMRTGHPEYGCFIAPDKTLCNFDLLDPTSSLPLVPRISTAFPWCGLTIDPRTLAVSTDLARYANTDLRNTLTVEYTRRPGSALVEKLIQSVKSRAHILFTDTALNGRTAYANVYATFLVSALKFAAYLGELRRFRVVFDAEFLWKAVQRVVRFMGRYVGSRATSARAKLEGKKGRGRKWKVSCTLQGQYVHWLGYEAFRTVLEREKTKKGEARSAVYRCMDRDTRVRLVGLIGTAAAGAGYKAARRKLGGVVARTLKEAQKSLLI